MSADPFELAGALADALEVPLPGIGIPVRLWLLGTGSHHDAAELVTFLFTGSGRSCRAVSSDGHAQLSGLIGPADTVVLVGPPEDEFLTFGHRVASGAGALVVHVPAADGAVDSTTAHLTAAAQLARLALAGGAPGATRADLDRLPGAVAAVAVDPRLPELPMPQRALVIAGTGPAAVTARHAAVIFRAAGYPAEGVEASDLLGGLITDLSSTDTVLVLDANRDVQSPASSLARSAATTGAHVVTLDGPEEMPSVCAQFPLTARLSLMAR